MGKIKTIVKKEIKLKVMTKGFLIGTLLGPLIILLFTFGPAFFIALSEKKPVNLVVVENTGRLQSEFQKVFNDTLENGMSRFRITFMDSLAFQQKQNELFAQLEKGKLKAVVVIPSTIFSNGKAIYYSKSASDIDFISNLKERLSNVVNREKMRQAGVDPLLVERLSTPVKLETRKVQKGSVQKSNVGQVWAMAFVFTMMLYMTSIFYGNAVMRGVLEEKTSRIVEILLSSINAFQLMLGKIIGIGLVGLIQYLFWGLMGIVGFVLVSVSKPEFVKYLQVQPSAFAYFVIFFLIGYFQIAGLFAAVGSMASSEEDMQPLSMPVNMLVIIPFIMGFSVIGNPGSSLGQILSFIPFFTPLIMFLRVLLISPPWYEVWGAIALNIGAIVLFGWISARIYRVGILMYGKRPNLPEIIRWIRYA